MKLRLMGPAEEMQEVVEMLQLVFDVHDVSEEYPNYTGISSDVRVYVDFDIPKRNDLEKDAIKIAAGFRNEIAGSFMVFVNNSMDITTAIAGNDKPNKTCLLMFLNSDAFIKLLNDKFNELGLSPETIQFLKENKDVFVDEESNLC